MIVLPRSPQYDANTSRRRDVDGAMPCCVCGKTVRVTGRTAWLHLHNGGGHVVTDAEAAALDLSADLGLHPIGGDCLARHPELRPYVRHYGRR